VQNPKYCEGDDDDDFFLFFSLISHSNLKVFSLAYSQSTPHVHNFIFFFERQFFFPPRNENTSEKLNVHSEVERVRRVEMEKRKNNTKAKHESIERVSIEKKKPKKKKFL
jgi:hypothetical protein